MSNKVMRSDAVTLRTGKRSHQLPTHLWEGRDGEEGKKAVGWVKAMKMMLW